MKTIRELRRERGWTQFELAVAVGVQPQTVYLWESGRRQPQVSQMRKLGEVFAMCSDDIDLDTSRESFRDAPDHAETRRQLGQPALDRDAVGRALMRHASETTRRTSPSRSKQSRHSTRRGSTDGQS